MIHPPSHLDVENPKFEGTPHIWIQWKGTNVCCDLHCSCGYSGHYDGDFFYFFKCPQCDKIWEVGTHVALYEPSPEMLARHPAIQEIEED